MASPGLAPLQWRILQILAARQPGWTLVGGAALVGFHLKHRTTRDLDLLWRDRSELGELPVAVAGSLRAEHLDVAAVQTSPAFHRFRVSDGGETCVVDLIAEPAPAIEAPATIRVGASSITVDTRHEILVGKLCALLGRSEIRDVQDVAALLDAGGDLDRALADAPRKDAGFSALTLAWVLKQLDLAALAAAAGVTPDAVEGLTAFRDRLAAHLLAFAHPGSD